MNPAPAPSRNETRNDTAAACPACGRPFTPAGRRRWCSDACRQAAWRRRNPTRARPPPGFPPRRGRPGTPPSTSAPSATSATSAFSADLAERAALSSSRNPWPVGVSRMLQDPA